MSSPYFVINRDRLRDRPYPCISNNCSHRPIVSIDPAKIKSLDSTISFSEFQYHIQGYIHNSDGPALRGHNKCHRSGLWTIHETWAIYGLIFNHFYNEYL